MSIAVIKINEKDGLILYERNRKNRDGTIRTFPRYIICGNNPRYFCEFKKLLDAKNKFAELVSKRRKRMTPEQGIEAIQALIDGEWDNIQLMKIGYLFTEDMANVRTIIKMVNNTKLLNV